MNADFLVFVEARRTQCEIKAFIPLIAPVKYTRWTVDCKD